MLNTDEIKARQRKTKKDKEGIFRRTQSEKWIERVSECVCVWEKEKRVSERERVRKKE